MRKSDFIFNVSLVPVDFFMLFIAGFSAYVLRLSPLVVELRPVFFDLPPLQYGTLVGFISAFFLVVFSLVGLYKSKIKRSQVEEFFQVVSAISGGMMAIIIFMFFRHDWFDSRFIMLAAWIFGIAFVSLGRFGSARVRRFLLKKYRIGVDRVLIVGEGDQANMIKDEIIKNPYSGYELLSHLPSIDLENIKNIVKNPGTQKIILATPNFSRSEVIDLANFCEDLRIDLKFVPDLFGAMSANIDIDILNGNPLIELKRTNIDGWGLIIKRVFDITFSLLLMLFLIPVFLLIAFLIKWDSRGPVFVRLKRISQSKEFDLIKFRSMVEGADKYKEYFKDSNERKDGPLFKMKDDPRVTRVGKIIRSKRVDELPQIFNVLKGNISLVGPRPHQPDEVALYERHHKKVLAVKAGVTGLAQVSGAEKLPFEEEVKLDRYYLENWSIKKDVVILLKTLGVLIFGRTEY
ncbi:MAG: hypothetical protein A2827_00230 [Candidatus Spechtbacteria bacterium RIFCSPHIGHO2_01_FULL_43_30]|uniref:Bacterial sugar transferase domain-containing protein n=1 Tax=Candidatus Spechtbacteria bacterium RIFCSPHIGHO2_01_FULL_43_30 TaxID=1802158 RepID=A0A1G2H5G3_9BACT|nr:MAG: hypothetical protein A2827_00230 [Candidatus Spechtbacteria bacterium RIFCSPHIGHO2_01_FULL_43_30]